MSASTEEIVSGRQAGEGTQRRWRPERGAALIAGAASLIVYLATLAPTVVGGNDAELVTAAHVLGIAHPTGYPLYLLLAKLFDLMPVATPPVRIAFLSALAGAGAAAAAAWAAARLTGLMAAGLLAGVIAAFSGPPWSQATVAEVYTLNALIIALSIAVAVRWHDSRRPREILLVALITGVGLAHHRSSVLVTLPLLGAMLVMVRPGWRVVAKSIALGITPLALYLYLPLRAAARPPLMWSDVSGWGAFVWHVTGRSFGQAYAFARPGAEVVQVAWEVVTRAASELTVGGLALAAIGCALLIQQRRMLGICLALSFAVLTAWNLWYLVPDWEVFFIPCYLIAGIWAAVGLAGVSRAVGSSLGRRALWSGTAVIGIALALVSLALLLSNWGKCNRSNGWRRYDESLAVLAQIEPDGVYITDWDSAIFWYLQVVEGRRPDIDVLSTTGVNMRPIADRQIAEAIPGLMAEHVLSLDPRDQAAQVQSALPLAAGLADALDWRRPVYCGVDGTSPPYPAGVRALWWNLFRLDRGPLDMLVPLDEADGKAAVADYEGGVSLAGVTTEPDEVRPREPVRITLDWRCTRALERAPFVLLSLADPEAGSKEQQGVLLRYGTWLGYGESPLAPTAEGYVYRQRVTAIAPTNAPPGTRELWVGIGESPTSAIHLQSVGEVSLLPPPE